MIYATRRSALALAQCRAFVERLRAAHPGLELVEKQVTTSGDRIQDRPLADIGGKGLFVKEIEEALLDRSADFAVHSIKDVPAGLPEGLSIACIPAREDPRDVLVAPRHKTFEALPQNATVGTSSLRRAIALRAARPDLRIVPIRGNVDTRLRKVDDGEVDAIVLAHAGLIRLGLGERVTSVIDPDIMLPAVGQGALGIEARSADTHIIDILRALHHPRTAVRVAAERGVLTALGGDCKTPMAAHANEFPEGKFQLRAFIAEPDGSHHRSAVVRVDWPASEAEADALGREMGLGLK